MIKTVGELKKFLEAFPDDKPILHYRSDMETSGWFEGIHPVEYPMVKTVRQTWDRFDHTDYSYECYEYNQNGEKMLVL